MQIGNTTALLALLGWPLVTVLFFRLMPKERALIWTILGAYMFLPQVSAIDLPVVPALNKETIPNLMAFAACMVVLGRMPELWPRGWPGRILLALFIVSPAITVLTNLEPIRFGIDRFGTMTLVDANALEVWGLPGLRIYDSVSALAQQAFLMLPFFLARDLLRSEEAIREIVLALIVAAGIYALPMLWEVRFSPQLHTRLYGFFQHDFAQAMRNGGFRPFVFMPHGLWVAFFAFMCTMAAAAWLRMSDRSVAGRNLLMVGFMFGLVVICKSMGALVFTLVFVPVILLMKPRFHLALAAVLVSLVLAYPMLRGSGLVPTERIIATVTDINTERAESLDYRFTNEDRILTHVEDKPFFGWGGWGRFMVYDPATGESQSIVDGQWIITIGHYGWLGFIAMFGLLALPVLSLWWHARKPEAPPVPISVSTLSLMLAVNMVDMLPNATLIPFTWLIAGALLGYAEIVKDATAEARRRRLRETHSGVAIGLDSTPARAGRSTPGRRTVL
ncbi:MAG: O-antigen ligase family protein [Rhodobacteraceae bacterium]|nr:O-antigen ligase family protein [Paracoccaceae bacterium]